jgi:hypothetical protein
LRGPPREQVGERRLLRANLLPEWIGQRRSRAQKRAGTAAVVRRNPDFDDFLRAMQRQRAQPDDVKQLEDRGVGADAERQRQQRDDREPRTLAQHARAVANVLPE